MTAVRPAVARILLSGLVLAAAGVPGFAAVDAHAGGGRIYYVDEGSGDILSVRPDGTGRRNLTARQRFAGSFAFPSPSLDGRQVAYSRYPTRAGWRAGGRGDLAVMRSDGSRPRLLTRTPSRDERTPAFGPRDRELYFGGEVGEGRHEIFRLALRTGAVKRLTSLDQGVTEDPAPSPDGRRLAFQTLDATRLALSEPNGADVIDVTAREVPGCPPECPVEEDPAYSPDARRLAFSSQRNGSAEIYVASADGRGAQPITSVAGAVEPSWAPDGRRIVFERPGLGIWTVGRDGGKPKRVVAGDRVTFPRWGP